MPSSSRDAYTATDAEITSEIANDLGEQVGATRRRLERWAREARES